MVAAPPRPAGGASFQGEFGLDGLRSAPVLELVLQPDGGAGSPFLVGTTHNCPEKPDPEEEYCPDSRLVLGSCAEHGQRRFVFAPCKKRRCLVCGRNGRYQIAKRLALGIRSMPCRSCGHAVDGCWGHGERKGVFLCLCTGYKIAASWHMLSFNTEEAEEATWKPRATKKLRAYVSWLRHEKGQPDLQYAATYELTKRGRLHINLIIGPWKAIPHAELKARWGARMSVEWVQDDGSMGGEAAKAYSPESLGNYLVKLKQSVPAEWGRRVSFSRKWPKLEVLAVRKGVVHWTQEWELKPVTIAAFEYERTAGWWQEVRPREWASLLHPPVTCDCFDLVAIEEDG